MVVDAQVDDDVGEAQVAAVPLDDEEPGGLLPAPVAARGLCRRERLEDALREAPAGRRPTAPPRGRRRRSSTWRPV
jgi:hypothetical protein